MFAGKQLDLAVLVLYLTFLGRTASYADKVR